jgi:hypothetical protein
MPTCRCSMRRIPLGLGADLQRLGWCAAQARSRLSAENWRAARRLQREFQEAAARKSDARETWMRCCLSLAALAGFALDDMTQDDGWRLMMVGRRLERLQFLAELLAAAAAFRRRADAERTRVAARHRRQHHHLSHALSGLAALGPTIDLLVFDQSNPRALAFQWHAIEYSLVRLAASLGGSPDDTLDEAVAAGGGTAAERHRWRQRARAARAPRPGRAAERSGRRRRQIIRSLVAQVLLAWSTRDCARWPHERRGATACGTKPSTAMAANVAHSHQLLHLTPRDSPRQVCHSRSITARAGAEHAAANARCLRQSRHAARVRLPHDRLEVLAEVGSRCGRDGDRHRRRQRPWETAAATLDAIRASPDRRITWKPAASAWSRATCRSSTNSRLRRRLLCRQGARPLLAAAETLMHKIHRDFSYAPGSTDHPHNGPRSVRGAPRRLPGFRPHHDRLPALARLGGALRERLLRTLPPPGAPPTGRRRRLARLGFGVLPAFRLDRSRPDQ